MSSAATAATHLAEGKLPLCAEMCATKALLAGDGDVLSDLTLERVVARGFGSGGWAGPRPTSTSAAGRDARRP